MPRGRVHISMPSIDSAAHSATANGLLLSVCCLGGIVDVCEFRVCCVYVRVQEHQQELQQSSWTPASPSPHRLPDEEGWLPRARKR